MSISGALTRSRSRQLEQIGSQESNLLGSRDFGYENHEQTSDRTAGNGRSPRNAVAPQPRLSQQRNDQGSSDADSVSPRTTSFHGSSTNSTAISRKGVRSRSTAFSDNDSRSEVSTRSGNTSHSSSSDPSMQGEEEGQDDQDDETRSTSSDRSSVTSISTVDDQHAELAACFLDGCNLRFKDCDRARAHFVKHHAPLRCSADPIKLSHAGLWQCIPCRRLYQFKKNGEKRHHICVPDGDVPLADEPQADEHYEVKYANWIDRAKVILAAFSEAKDRGSE